MAIAANGEILIAEIKSSVADFRADRKWQDYLGFADRYFFAVDPDFPAEILPETEGLIIADAFGGEIVREAQHRSVAGSRRRSLLLRFARMAALRLNDANDPRGYRL